MERRSITVQGVVQGVGFRPFVHGLAVRLQLGGFVQNLGGCVHVEVEGPAAALDGFLDRLTQAPPPLAHIVDCSWTPQPLRNDGPFRIQASASDAVAPIWLAPDAATCADCLRELFDPADRRCGYPFLSCTNCGPRLTVIRGAPYDRSRTTMAGFAMCSACQAEYHDPADRRFHAQPIACPACGPQLSLLDAGGRAMPAEDAVEQFAAALRAGKIGALKGLGGFHLACDASNPAAVDRLRRRKQRDDKPFAVLVRDLAAARALCTATAAEAVLLQSMPRPIVLLRKRPDAQIAEAVAPGNPHLGVMLPYTPLHHLLTAALAGLPLVLTSGNRSDEPIACEDADALARLAEIADLFLLHDRPIHVRCDDSVTRVVADCELPLRRSRGYAPLPLFLPHSCTVPILAVGGQLKGTFALGRRRHAVLSHHLGALDHYDAYQAFEKDVALYEQLFGIQPELIVHDLPPDYASTRYAQQRAARSGIATLAVQHHHAHLASCMAEHGLTEPVIGVTLDGTGYGLDGAVWGGEFLVGDYAQFRRAAHLREVRMPGGEAAIREPWRMAAAQLLDAGLDLGLLARRVGAKSLQTIAMMLQRGFNSPRTSSMGRLIDAAAALAGVRDRTTYEGQAAVELEWLAAQSAADEHYPFELGAERLSEAARVVDTRPLIRAVAEDVAREVPTATVARRFHTTVVEIIAAVCGAIRTTTALNDVVLSGGVFSNALLTAEVGARLTSDGFRAYRHRLAPPNDGGLSLGQLAVAARQAANY